MRGRGMRKRVVHRRFGVHHTPRAFMLLQNIALIPICACHVTKERFTVKGFADCDEYRQPYTFEYNDA